jgi:Leucine-rich repeat (LRR) protein
LVDSVSLLVLPHRSAPRLSPRPQCAPGLRCIFAQQNCLARIEHLGSLRQLDTLNVSANRLDSLDGLEQLQCLTSLQAAHNQLRTLASLAALAAVPGLSSVDVTDNELDGEAEELVALLARMPSLRALYLCAGNPIAAKLRPYRKRLVAALPQLAYLDDRPVFDAERRAAEAWARGGETEERVERERIIVRGTCICIANGLHIRSDPMTHILPPVTGGEGGCHPGQLPAHHTAA